MNYELFGSPERSRLLPFQVEDSKAALSRVDTILAHEPGLGKSAIAIAVANGDPLTRRCLIVVPNSLRAKWKAELKKWETKGLSVACVDESWPREDIVICNFEKLKKFPNEIRATPWDLLIVDEFQKLKSRLSDRMTQVFGYGDITPIEARRRLYLSGTPLDRPKDLFPLLRVVDADVLGRHWLAYVTRYCGPVTNSIGIETYDGASNLNELHRSLINRGLCIRRRKADCLDLPPLTHEIVTVEVRGEAIDAVRNELAIYDQFERGRLHGPCPKVSFREFTRARMRVARYKLRSLIDEIQRAVDRDEQKIVVFATYRFQVNEVRKAFPDALIIDGRVPETERQRVIDSFQLGPARLIVLTTEVGGSGIDLTASSFCLFSGLDGSFVTIRQALDRLLRIGQTKPVIARFIVLENSLDARLAELMLEKQESLVAVMDGTSGFK